METRLNKSLYDLIIINKSAAVTVFRRGGGAAAAIGRGGSGLFSRLANRPPYRTTPYSFYPLKGPDLYRQHDLYANHGVGGFGGGLIEMATKLYISNLDYGVSNDVI